MSDYLGYTDYKAQQIKKLKERVDRMARDILELRVIIEGALWQIDNLSTAQETDDQEGDQ